MSQQSLTPKPTVTKAGKIKRPYVPANQRTGGNLVNVILVIVFGACAWGILGSGSKR